ncbi:MAG TPA: hypothetical protein PKI41_04680 [Candidatus Competibacteraceae bacterium]|nr:hypothetical protein [Candidatus Competibacteraceae bacterium]HQA26179.1 hypothetical protein [Candidatus Competibacteraceae bacterium]HQD57825.1 hypothetical protein [Candidatus Competibacteraceae bacterium]
MNTKRLPPIDDEPEIRAFVGCPIHLFTSAAFDPRCSAAVDSRRG